MRTRLRRRRPEEGRYRRRTSCTGEGGLRGRGELCRRGRSSTGGPPDPVRVVEEARGWKMTGVEEEELRQVRCGLLRGLVRCGVGGRDQGRRKASVGGCGPGRRKPAPVTKSRTGSRGGGR